MSPALVIVLAAAAAVAGVMVVAAVTARRMRRVAVVDVAWGFAFVALAVTSAIVAGLLQPGSSVGDPGLRWLVTAMVVVWGLRLTWHLAGRIFGSDHDDPRYEKMLGGTLAEIPFATVVVKVFLLQGVIVMIVALPVLVAVQSEAVAWWCVWLGVAVWAIGLGCEAVADRQLAAFMATPDRPRLLTTGIWSWSRHPNYFGDACVWWGIWLAGAASTGWPGALVGLVGPIAMTWFLTAVSGVRLSERRMQGRPGWDEYAARTSIFVPYPPRR
jgi:steroid 5-alpha reductase family enzyme